MDIMLYTVTSGLSQLKEGTTRALAVTTAQRSLATPHIPHMLKVRSLALTLKHGSGF